MKGKKLLIIGIILIAAVLRLYNLGNYPALNADEAAIGYNAYSLIETGMDEHGNSWPIHFQSFNDYKPGLYFYLVLPFVKTLGLNEWSVRLPNALLGIATVYLIYLLVKQLFKNGFSQAKVDKMALISALMLAISPWHIHFSRGGWEVNTAAFFAVMGVWLFLTALKRPKYFIVSVTSFVLSMYTYHAARVVLPLLGLGLAIIYWRDVIKNYKMVLLAGILGLIVLFPLLKDITSGEVVSRAAGVGIFADPGPLSRIHEQRGEHEDFRAFFPSIMHNKPINYGLAFLENWSEHFNGNFLFVTGDVIQRNKVPEMGQMYPFDLLFILLGFAFIIFNWGKSNKSKKGWLLVFAWLIFAPFAAALTFQSPHALRAQILIIPLVIVSAYGLLNLLEWLQMIGSKYLRFTAYAVLVLCILTCFVRYQHMYWIHMAKEYPFSSQYGVKELVNYVKDNQDQYERVVVTTKYDQPYVLFLFYMNYKPQNFQGNHKLTAKDNYGFSTVDEFDKYVFKQIEWETYNLAFKNSLIVGTDDEIPLEANIVKEIYGTNGYMYFEVVAN